MAIGAGSLIIVAIDAVTMEWREISSTSSSASTALVTSVWARRSRLFFYVHHEAPRARVRRLHATGENADSGRVPHR